MEDNSAQRLQPWFSMWKRPRATIQQIVNEDSEHMALLLAALPWFVPIAQYAIMVEHNYNIKWLMALPVIIVIGPISTITFLYINSAVIRWTGKWLGGRASAKNIRTATAWSFVPILWASLLWMPFLALTCQQLLPIGWSDNPTLVALSLIQGGAGIWTFFIFLQGLSLVQRFSVWKAFGNTLLAWLIMAIPITIIFYAVIIGTLNLTFLLLGVTPLDV